MKIDLTVIHSILKKLQNVKILVIGDLALDEMVYGDTERISREAPVLILQHTHTNYILGAASNAAHNVVAISPNNVGVIGIVGDDYQAIDLKNAFEDAGIKTSSLITDKTRKTITKTRISGACSQSVTQQIVRIDRQTKEPLSKETETKIIEMAQKMIPDFDAVILSDYHIGTLTDNVIKSVINVAKKYDKKVITDAQCNLNKYNGVYSMTPNLPDTQKHVGYSIKTKEDYIKAGNTIINDIDADNILITCGSDGMVVIEKGGKYTHIPVFNKSQVFDVTGAGDTVTAVYTLALTAGATPVYAAIIGNIAAGIVIKKFGCATTTVEEIANAVPSCIEVDN